MEKPLEKLMKKQWRKISFIAVIIAVHYKCIHGSHKQVTIVIEQ